MLLLIIRSEAKGSEGISTIRCLHKANNLRFVYLCLEIGALLSFLSLFNMAQREGSLSAGRAARVSGANRPFFYHFQSVPFRCCCCCCCCCSLHILYLRPSAYVWDFSRNDDSLAWHGKANNKNTRSVMGLNQWTGKKE